MSVFIWERLNIEVPLKLPLFYNSVSVEPRPPDLLDLDLESTTPAFFFGAGAAALGAAIALAFGAASATVCSSSVEALLKD